MNATGIWEPNAGLVDGNGIWHPIYSTGRDGIDDKDWYDRKVKDLKNELGYDCRDVSSQYHEKIYYAIKEVFGDEWYELDGVDHENDPRVLEKVKKDRQMYEEFVRRRGQYKQELVHREASLFMQAFDREIEDDRPEEVGLLDDGHIKETCALFCSKYKGNVGFMAHVLDGMVRLKYNPWCTCSDCGEQFQLLGYECFSHMVDSESYHGNGGIGVIMTRIQCDDCIGITRCQKCGDNNLPNRSRPDGGKSDFENYDFLASVLYEWLEVCWGCASGFECDHLQEWREDIHLRVETPLGKKFYEIEEVMKEKYGEEKGHDLYEKMLLDVEGRKTINKIRDMLEKDAREEFEPSIGDEWFSDRICEKVPEREELINEEKQ